jgi:hypothetical protein
MDIKLIIFAGTLVFNSFCLANEKIITQNALNSLIKNNKLRELIHKARDIPPPQHNDSWNKNVTTSFRIKINEFNNHKFELKAFKRLRIYFRGISHFFEFKKIVSYPKISSLISLHNCHENKFQSAYRYNILFFKTYFNIYPQGSDFLIKIGEHIQRTSKNTESLLFFERFSFNQINNLQEIC